MLISILVILAVKVFQVRTVVKIIFAQGKWQRRVEVVIKQLRNDRREHEGFEQAKEEFFNEHRIFQIFNHPNIIHVSSTFFAVMLPWPNTIFTLSMT